MDMISRLTLTFFLFAIGDASPTVILKSLNSVVKGATVISYDGRPFEAFRGIPYAKSTSGALRFKPPQPMGAWDGVFDATVSGSSCPQYDMKYGVIGSEDCLNLNVYSPNVSTNDGKLLPVMVFIHGGRFSLGSGSYEMQGPEKLMDFDVVLVSINYRLDILGFLSTEDSNAYGNYGMLDQVEALRWVKNNIEAFGGDPSKVTIFGHSAGAISVVLHLLSPLSTGLFHSAIIQSGSPYMTKGLFQPHPLNWAKKLAKKVDCPHTDTAKLVDCFRGKTFQELLEAAKSFMVSANLPNYSTPSKEAPGGPGFLTEDPTVLMREGRFVNRVPTIIGTTSHESYLFHNEFLNLCKGNGRQFIEESFPKCLHYLVENVTSSMDNVFKAIRKEYYEDLNLDDPDVVENVGVRIMSDIIFGAAPSKTAEFLSKSGIPTYVYQITHIGKYSLAGIFGGKNGKYAGHGDELFLQFNFLFSNMEKMTEDDGKVSKLINSLWTEFSNNQALEVSDSATGERLTWEKYDIKRPRYLEIKVRPEMREGKLTSKDDFWTETIHSLIAASKLQKHEL